MRLLAVAAQLALVLLFPVGSRLEAAENSGDPMAEVVRYILGSEAGEARAALLPLLEGYRLKEDREGEAIAVFLLGLINSIDKQPAAAAVNMETSSLLFASQGEDYAAWFVLQSLAESEREQGDLEAAISTYHRSLAFLERSSASAGDLSMASFVRLSTLLASQGSVSEVRPSYPPDAKVLVLLGAEASSRLELGEIMVDAGRLEEASRELARVDEIAGLFGGMFDAQLAYQVGRLRRRQWRLDEAREDYQRALTTLDPADELLEVLVWRQLAELDSLEGRIDDALAWNDKALAKARSRGKQVVEAFLLHDRGKLLMDGRRLAAAEEAFVAAQKIAGSSGHLFLQGLIHADLGMLDMQRGRNGRAVAHLETAASLFGAAGVQQARGGALALLAIAYYLGLGCRDIGCAVMEDVIDVADEHSAEIVFEFLGAMAQLRESPDDPVDTAVLDALLANSSQGRVAMPWEQIKACFKATSAVDGPPLELPAFGIEHGDPSAAAYSHAVLGLVHFQRGELSAAREQWSKALALSMGGENDARLLVMLGLSYWHERKTQEALPYLVRAVDALEMAGNDLVEGELLSTFLGNEHQAAYLAVVEILAEQGRFEEAFDYAERARAQAFLRELGARRFGLRGGGDPALIGEIEALRVKISGWEHESLVSTPAESARLAEDLKQARRRYETLLTRLKISRRDDFAAGDVSALSLRSVQEELPAGATLVSYLTSFKQVHAWAVDKDSVRYVSLPLGPEELSRAACWAERVGGGRHGRSAKPIQSPCGEDTATAEDVYRMLFSPLSGSIRNSKLILVPHGVLHYLPFAALRDPQTGSYLIETHTLTYLPSASALRVLRQNESPVAGRALVLGAPAAADASLEDLPAAEKEAVAVSALLGTSASLGPEAAESAIYHLNGEVDLLHVAAHGIYDPDNPLFSRIALAPGGGHDGNLEVHEILTQASLSDVNLVVLSACRTAAGERSGGDEIVGLTRAFLYAGSPGVISTLWDIDDSASALLMERFYRRLTRGEPAAEALRDAQLSLLRSPAYNHPYYWAAFSLAGDPQGRWGTH